jgi:protein-disulfide isomerase
VQSTPTFFINGTQVVGAQPYETFQRLVEAELAQAGQ